MSGVGRYIVDAVVLEHRSPTQLARDHGIVPGCEPSAAGDTIRLEAGKRSLERFYPAEMGTVGSRTHRKLGISVEEESDPLFLHPRSECLEVI